MAKALFVDLLNDRVGLNSFYEWVIGKESQDISSSLNRTEFILYVLNYIQEETNKFILPAQSSAVQQEVTNDKATKLQEQDSNKETQESEPKNEFNERTPFKVINKVTPPRTSSQPFARFLDYGNETRQDVLNCSVNQDSRNISTSTPLPFRRNNSGNDLSFGSSPQSCGSFQSDQSSMLHTPQLQKSTGNKFHRSGSSHRFSPQSVSPTFSPTSSQYSDTFPDIGTRNRRTPHSPCLADFITTKPTSQKSCKRIKPTQLTTVSDKDESNDSKKGNKTFGAVSRPFIPMNSPLQSQSEERGKSNFEEERSLLKQKRTECLNTSLEGPVIILKRSPVNLEKSNSGFERSTSKQTHCSDISSETSSISSPAITMKIVEPDPSLITGMDKLMRLASVYTALLNANLVPNITSELFFILNLLTIIYKFRVSVNVSYLKDSKCTVNSDKLEEQCGVPLQNLCLEGQMVDGPCVSVKPSKVLRSVHDCVMFAAVVIEKQTHLLHCLDKGLIRLLLENARLSLFVPHFIPHLVHILQLKETKETKCLTINRPCVLENGPVLFHIETDNRDNFSSDSNFQSFKKQRDGFYDILHEWRLKNTDPLWASKRFPAKVQHILAISSDPVNMMHLARLFCAQLTSCNSELEEETNLDLHGVPKDKLSRLQARFSKPQTQSGSGCPRPPAQFLGEHQFYQQFLQLAVGTTFSAHVVDCLVYRLNMLDCTAFFIEGLGIEESKVQVGTCVTTCCLLAKFLGLIVFSPYKALVPLTPNTLQSQLSVRQLVVPQVNLVAYLQRAAETNRLVITVPWIVAFLGMMDPATPYLPCYNLLFQLLVSIYRSLPLPHISPLSSLLLRCTLGWLFDVSFFPEAMFFSLITNSPRFESSSPVLADVDVKDVVDNVLLLEVCPFLGSLRLLLSASSSIKQGSARHITPVPAHPTPSTQISIVQTIELQLEESFLSAQAASFRTTVEFVVGRISSSCIKHICSHVIASFKEKASTAICKDKEEIKKKNKTEMKLFLSELCEATEIEIEAALTEHCGARLGAVLATLLGPDASDSTVLSTAHVICSRRCRERVVTWINSHINLLEMFSKLLSGTEVRLPGGLEVKPESSRMTMEHQNTAMPPSELLIEVQDNLCQFIQNRDLVPSEQQVLHLINTATDTVRYHRDLIETAKLQICTIFIDICIVLLAHFPAVVTPAVLCQLCSLWSLSDQVGGQLERIMSARNVLLLCQGGPDRARLSWQQLSCLLVELLKQELLTPLQLETQCVALFQLDWPLPVLSLMRTCLSLALEKIKQDSQCRKNSKFLLMLEWVSEMTGDLAKEDNFDDL